MRWSTGSIVLLSLLVSGCSGRVEYFSLQPSASAAAFRGAGSGPAVEVREVRFPSYLNNPQLTESSNSGAVVVNERQRWVEDLGDNFERVFIQDLTAKLGSAVVFRSGAVDVDPDLVVQVEVSQFDVTDDSVATVVAQWSVSDSDERRVLTSGVTNLSSPDRFSTVEERVAAQSALVDSLAGAVAEGVTKGLGGKKPRSAR